VDTPEIQAATPPNNGRHGLDGLHCPENSTSNPRPCPFHGPAHLTYQLPSRRHWLTRWGPPGRTLLESSNLEFLHSAETPNAFSPQPARPCPTLRLEILTPPMHFGSALFWRQQADPKHAGLELADLTSGQGGIAHKSELYSAESPLTVLLIILPVLFLFLLRHFPLFVRLPRRTTDIITRLTTNKSPELEHVIRAVRSDDASSFQFPAPVVSRSSSRACPCSLTSCSCPLGWWWYPAKARTRGATLTYLALRLAAYARTSSVFAYRPNHPSVPDDTTSEQSPH
jgi:hypothetical protein